MRKLVIRHRQFLVYLAGGLLCALIDVGLMQLLIGAGVNHVAAVSAGFAAGLLVNYSFHSSVTFQGSPTAVSFVRYACVVGGNYLLTLAFVSLSVALADSALAGKLLSLPVVAINGFFLGKYWIFK